MLIRPLFGGTEGDTPLSRVHREWTGAPEQETQVVGKLNVLVVLSVSVCVLVSVGGGSELYQLIHLM